VTPWTAAHQTSLSITNFQNLIKKKKRKPTEHKNYSIILITNPASKNKME